MSEEITEIRCPKCNSNQLTSNKKGFSFTNAIVGGVLTGGVGLLAGTIGSSKIKITCLACGQTFKPGEGKIIKMKAVEGDSTNMEIIADPDDEKVLSMWNETPAGAVKYYSEQKKITLSEAKAYCNKIAVEKGMKPIAEEMPKGCIFIFIIIIAGLFIYFLV